MINDGSRIWKKWEKDENDQRYEWYNNNNACIRTELFWSSTSMDPL